MGKEPKYTIGREAEGKAMEQEIINLLRRSFRKPILQTSDQARAEHKKKNGY